jgi:hypothetical protein
MCAATGTMITDRDGRLVALARLVARYRPNGGLSRSNLMSLVDANDYPPW